MSQTVTIREVNQHTSAVFDRISRGEELIVTKAGHPQAKIIPYRPSDTYEQMIADGRILPAAKKPDPFRPLRAKVDVDQLLDDERADRSWL